MRITVFGLGYVGTAMAVLLAQHHDVTAVDISAGRVADVTARRSPVVDPLITEFLETRDLSLRATTDGAKLCLADFVVIATPTNYDTELTSLTPRASRALLRRWPSIRRRPRW